MKKCEHYNVMTIVYDDDAKRGTMDWDETDAVDSYEEAYAEAKEQWEKLDDSAKKRVEIWIQGWNGGLFPDGGADDEEEVFCIEDEEEK